jgi:putative DNA primase/helicase
MSTLEEITETQSVKPSEQPSREQIIASLAALSKLEYETQRSTQAKALKIRASALDDLVKIQREKGGRFYGNRKTPYVEVEPYPLPVDPAQLLDDVVAIIQRFIVIDIHQAHAAALWVAHTWFIDVVEVTPLAIINAPEKACGKTMLLTLIGLMAHRPLPAANASSSALFRAVEMWKPTILIDEADTFFKDNFELHGLVNAGYLRDGFVLRSEVVGDTFEPKMYSVFSPKALAGIALEKHLPDATMSRGIVFNLRRRLSNEIVERLRHADKTLFTRATEKLARFQQDYSAQVRMARPALPEALSDREQDNWEALLAVASCAGSKWILRASEAALKLSSEGKTSESVGSELLSDIQQVFESKKVTKISTVELITALCADDELSWSTYNRGKQLSPKQLSAKLKCYDISSRQMRIGTYGNPQRGFDLEQFSDAFERYLTTPGNLPLHVTKLLQTNNGRDLTVTDTKNCNVTALSDITPESRNCAVCNAVTAKRAVS